MTRIIFIAFFLHLAFLMQAQLNNIDPVVAHRGAWKMDNLPQNSIASLRNAIKMGCMGSEFDVRMTADDILIVHHDPDISGLKIDNEKYARLSKFPLSNGEILPTLEDFLREGLVDNHTTKLILEIKSSDLGKKRNIQVAYAVANAILDHHAEKQVVIISFDIEIMKVISDKYPTLSTQYLNGDLSPKELKALGIKGVDYHYDVFKSHPEYISQAKELGLSLNVWTVNNPNDMDFFLEKGFDYITTNEPELLYSFVRKNIPIKDWQLVWRDEFTNDGLPDTTKWSYDVGGHGWGNNEKQYYLSNSLKNSYQENGILHIVALNEPYENSEYTSAKLTTYGKFLFQYGKIEVSAMLPAGNGTWPAIWMLPQSIRTKEEGWPLCGEIDIMEHVGKNPNVVHTSLHSKLYNHIINTQVTHFDTMQDVSRQFHTYGIEWDEKGIKFIYDGTLYFEALKGENGKITTNEGWPFDKPYYLILNLAIGGNWGGPIDPDILPAEMQVDYVRMYKKI